MKIKNWIIQVSNSTYAYVSVWTGGNITHYNKTKDIKFATRLKTRQEARNTLKQLKESKCSTCKQLAKVCSYSGILQVTK